MVSIPRTVCDRYGIKPGWKMEWFPGDEENELLVRLIPDRAELGRRLRGGGRHLRNGRDAVAGLVDEREREDRV